MCQKLQKNRLVETGKFWFRADKLANANRNAFQNLPTEHKLKPTIFPLFHI